ncbi:hypothetical protein L596_022595 [Steinernema carpocapsae]|uniref:CHK kinase-like domain-containing protein n=1 Tax=Steinernema carpocapsae TaxID=34508 RepID=A0A4U5MM74_STECR|nr:hypothetical protein L596_022595 [Steinernema carpocapsae]
MTLAMLKSYSEDDTTQIGAGQGMLSKVFNHVLQLSNGETHSVIVKIPGGYFEENQDDANEHKKPLPYRAHNRECKFFNDFPHLNEYIQAPYVYLAVPYDDPKRDPVVVMESLVGRTKVGSVSDSFTSEQLFNIAKDIAKFQSYFLTMADQSYVDKYPMDIVDEVDDIKFFKEHFDQIGDYGDGSLKPLVSELSPILFNLKVWHYTTHKAYKSLGLPPVMCNDDTWVNNILWNLNEDGSISNHVGGYIDWQFAHAGCLPIDLVCSLVLCVKPSLQREIQYKVLQVYYDTLKKEVEKKGGKIDFNLDQVKKCYQANFCGIVARDLGFQPLSLKQGSSKFDDWTMKAKQEEMFIKCKLMLEQTAEFVKTLPKKLLE